MTTETYWLSKAVVIDWSLQLVDGTPATGATVTATFTRPDGTTLAGTVTEVGDADDGGRLYRAAVDTDQAGQWAYRLQATGVADGAEEGTFDVLPSRLGAPPPTLDPATDLGRVRLLVPDLDEAALLFTDAQLAALLDMEGSVKLAAAQALDVVASSEAMVSKVIKTQDLSTDGAKVSAELRARAAALREAVLTGVGGEAGVGVPVWSFPDPDELLHTDMGWE
jgi:hypothetical protein